MAHKSHCKTCGIQIERQDGNAIPIATSYRKFHTIVFWIQDHTFVVAVTGSARAAEEPVASSDDLARTLIHRLS